MNYRWKAACIVTTLVAGTWACAGAGDSETLPHYVEPPTGAKVQVDEFGHELLLDEECGYLEGRPYADYFQHGMFRDGAVSTFGVTSSEDRRLWLVDGSSLWYQAYGLDGRPEGQPVREIALLGQLSAVGSRLDRLIAADVNGRLVGFYEDFDDEYVWQAPDVVLDIALWGDFVAVAMGASGIQLLLFTEGGFTAIDRYQVGGHAAGVRFQDELVLESRSPFGGSASGLGVNLYYAACDRAGILLLDVVDGELEQVGTTGELSHRNAKDAHGMSDVLAIANNGRGLWATHLGGFTVGGITEADWWYYTEPDPLFYANSVYVDEDLRAYLAAGNQSLRGFDLDVFEPVPEIVLKDPIDVEYDLEARDEKIIGLGNFRKVGERTIVYANESLTQSYEIVEPRPWAVMSRSVTSPDIHWLAWRSGDGKLMSYAKTTSSNWVEIDHLSFGLRSTDVTSSTELTAATQTLFALNGTEPVVRAEIRTKDEFALHTSDAEIAVLLGPVVGEMEMAYAHSKYEQEIDPYGLPSIHQFGNGFALTREFSHLMRCPESEPGTDGLHKVKMRYGTYVSGETTYVWCSRHLDPWVPQDRPIGDAGTRLYACSEKGEFCALEWVLPVSGVLQIDKLDEEWLVLADNRRTGIGSIRKFGNATGIYPENIETWILSSRPLTMLVHMDRAHIVSADRTTYSLIGGTINKGELP